LGGVLVLVLALAGYATWQNYDVAAREINVFTARAADALHDEQFDRALRCALHSYPTCGRLPWTTPFSTALEGKLAGGSPCGYAAYSRGIRSGFGTRPSAATASGL